jgi:hypothetical protein
MAVRKLIAPSIAMCRGNRVIIIMVSPCGRLIVLSEPVDCGRSSGSRCRVRPIDRPIENRLCGSAPSLRAGRRLTPINNRPVQFASSLALAGGRGSWRCRIFRPAKVALRADNASAANIRFGAGRRLTTLSSSRRWFVTTLVTFRIFFRRTVR